MVFLLNGSIIAVWNWGAATALLAPLVTALDSSDLKNTYTYRKAENCYYSSNTLRKLEASKKSFSPHQRRCHCSSAKSWTCFIQFCVLLSTSPSSYSSCFVLTVLCHLNVDTCSQDPRGVTKTQHDSQIPRKPSFTCSALQAALAGKANRPDVVLPRTFDRVSKKWCSPCPKGVRWSASPAPFLCEGPRHGHVAST